MGGSETFWQSVLTGAFTLLGVFIGIGATYFLERQASRRRDQRQREMLGRLLLTEVRTNMARLQEDYQIPGELTRQYQKEVYHEMLPQIGLFSADLIGQIMDFYHGLMHIEYLLEVGKARSTAHSQVIVRDELPDANDRAQRFGERLVRGLQRVGSG